MPTISFAFTDLKQLIGSTISIEKLQEMLQYGKADLESYDQESDEVTVKLDDTNLPYLWSAEGIARLCRGVLGKDKGIPKMKITKGQYKIIADASVRKIRPFIAAFVAKGRKVDDYTIKQMIQLQEKLCDNYGRKRQKIAIGVYRCDKIKFPVFYKAVHPSSVSFVPLDFRKEMTLKQILEEHPKGKEYAWILQSAARYPLLIDSNKQVLSFPPIINSASTGKIEEGDQEFLVEATGTELESVQLALNIFAQALYDRGFEISSVIIRYSGKSIITPLVRQEAIKLNSQDVKSMLGIELKEAELRKVLEKARYHYAQGKVAIPWYRADILHKVDVIEDIAIFYDYNKIPEQKLERYTLGGSQPIVLFINKVRELLIGAGFQEMMTAMLSNKELLYRKMNIKDFGTIELDNPMSESFAVVRSWLIPHLLDILSKNKHVEYPQNIFEQGIVTVRGQEIVDSERVAAVLCNDQADYTRIKQVLDALLMSFGLEYTIEEAEHQSFVEGRVGRVIVQGKKVAYIGEISPSILENFDITMPVAGFELNLSELFGLLSKKV